MKHIIHGSKAYHNRREVAYRTRFANPDNPEQTIIFAIYERDRISKKIPAPPHFHVCIDRDATTISTIACLRLDCAEYYDHGYKRNTELSQNLLNEIDSQLRKKLDPKYFGYNNTEFDRLVRAWNAENPDNEIANNHHQPDYTKTRRL